MRITREKLLSAEQKGFGAPLINVSEAAKTKAKIREKAQFMSDK